MKRIASLILCLCLALTLGVPALAESEDMEAELARVTSRVKEILEIDDNYTSFSGNRNDGLRPGWYLSWSDDGRDLSVTCDGDGVVLEMSRWQRETIRTYGGGLDAAFPVLPEGDARAEAERCLERLMGEGETALIESVNPTLQKNGAYQFAGVVCKNGLPTPIRFFLAVGPEGLSNYHRSDSYPGYVGELPSAESAVTEAAAAASLAEAARLDPYYFDLCYVERDGEARLRYVPAGPYTVVDAKTGELVDMDALYASFGGGAENGKEMPAAEAAMAMDAGGGRGLTAVELSSIANYRDVLSREALNEAVRALPGLGLAGFAADRCSYAMDSDGNVTASLRYACAMDEAHLFGFSRAAYEESLTWDGRPTVFKYCELDAKTGELLALWTNYPLWDGDRTEGAGTYAELAKAFLAAAAPERFAQTDIREGSTDNGWETLTYVRTHDGYFFPANSLEVRVNRATGVVDDYRAVWDDEVTFASSDGIVERDAALDAYLGALTLTLGYVAWPEAIDYSDPVLYRWADWGYTFVESLRPAWYYRGTEDVAGVDALTGEAITEKADGTLSYGDLQGVPAREKIEALGAAGIGFAGGFFKPAEALTQRDAVELLLRAMGCDPSSWDDDTRKNEAVWYGLVAAGDWEPDRTLSRADFARMIVAASPYGAAAELSGAWASAYGDDGYAAVSAALGMTEAGKPLSRWICTRADAADLLYRFMMR